MAKRLRMSVRAPQPKVVQIGHDDLVSVLEGKVLYLVCKAKGSPVPNIVWYKDNKAITASEGRVSVKTNNNGRLVRLKINATSIDDTGNYTCRAENLNGYIKKWVYLAVESKVVPTERAVTSTVVPSAAPSEESSPRWNGHDPLEACSPATCINGDCSYNSELKYFCKCKAQYIGPRCSKLRPSSLPSQNSSQTGDPDCIGPHDCTRTVDRTLTYVGIGLAGIFLLLILGISWFMARQRRKDWRVFRRKSKSSFTTKEGRRPPRLDVSTVSSTSLRHTSKQNAHTPEPLGNSSMAEVRLLRPRMVWTLDPTLRHQHHHQQQPQEEMMIGMPKGERMKKSGGVAFAVDSSRRTSVRTVGVDVATDAIFIEAGDTGDGPVSPPGPALPRSVSFPADIEAPPSPRGSRHRFGTLPAPAAAQPRPSPSDFAYHPLRSPPSGESGGPDRMASPPPPSPRLVAVSHSARPRKDLIRHCGDRVDETEVWIKQQAGLAVQDAGNGGAGSGSDSGVHSATNPLYSDTGSGSLSCYAAPGVPPPVLHRNSTTPRRSLPASKPPKEVNFKDTAKTVTIATAAAHRHCLVAGGFEGPWERPFGGLPGFVTFANAQQERVCICPSHLANGPVLPMAPPPPRLSTFAQHSKTLPNHHRPH